VAALEELKVIFFKTLPVGKTKDFDAPEAK